MGLNPYTDRITCICAMDRKRKIYIIDEDESNILKRFVELIKNIDTMVTWNGREFDLPFIKIRCLKHKIKIQDRFILVDLKQIFTPFKFEDGLRRPHLSEVASLLGIGAKLMSGSAAPKLFEKKQYDILKKYCMKDVLLTKNIYEKIKKLSY